MSKRILSLMVAMLLVISVALAGCTPAVESNGSTGTSAATGAATTAPKPTESKATEPASTAPAPTEPAPTEHVHSYTEVVTAPTCTEAGYTMYTCVCGDSYQDKETAAKGHSWGEWVTTKAATEDAEGLAERACANCDAKESKTLAKLDHVHSYTETVTAPTCTQKGYTTYTCACGDSYQGKETAAKGHSYGAWKVTTAHSCTADEISSRVCDACGKTETKVTKEACHDYQNGKCSYCGKTVSVGLSYEKWDDRESYVLIGMGTCTDSNIVIPDTYNGLPVTGIGRYAFEYADVESIVLPDSIDYIDSWAFYGATITEFTVPAAVTHMYWNAFERCNALQNIYVQAGSKTFCSVDGVLYSKDGKTLIFYPSGKKESSFTVPEGVTGIGNYAFCGANWNLGEIKLAGSVKEIGKCAFYGACITSMHIPAATVAIHSTAFDYCIYLEKITAAEGNAAYCAVEGVLFSKDKKTLVRYPAGNMEESYTVPAGVTAIADHAFSWCGELNEVILPEGLVSIGASAFSDGAHPMSSNMGINEIRFPASLKEIGENAFEGCYLRGFYVDEKNTAFSAKDGVLFDKDYTTLLLYPVNRSNANDTLLGDEQYSYRIPDTVTHIAANALVGCSWASKDLYEIVIPVSVVSIGDNAFSSGLLFVLQFRYEGTLAQWESVEKGENWYYELWMEQWLICTDGSLSLALQD